MRRGVLLLAGLVLLACSGRQRRPPGPPPEYERPQVMPWDAGVPVDPLDDVRGEAVDDLPDDALADAGAVDAESGQAPADAGGPADATSPEGGASGAVAKPGKGDGG